MDGVAAVPRPCRVRCLTRGSDLDPQGAIAAALDDAIGRLEQHREVARQKLRVVPTYPGQTVAFLLYLFTVVEHVGDVSVRLGQLGRQTQRNSHPALHVTGAAADQVLTLAARRKVRRVGQRDRVKMSGQHDPLTASQVGACDDSLPVTGHLQVAQWAQRDFDGVSDALFVAADRLDVAQGCGQGDDISSQIET